MVARSTHPTRHLLMFAIFLATLLLFWPSLIAAINLALHDDRYLQIVLAPLVCLFLIFRARGEVFSQARYSPRAGIPLLSFAILIAGISVYYSESSLLLVIAAIILAWIAAFVLCYGVASFRAVLYPSCCLFLMIPLPLSWMDRVAAGFQHGSAAVGYEILRLSGI